MAVPLEKEVANLRLQLNALEKATREASLPEAIARMRKTVKWSSIVIAVALVVSALISMARDRELRALEERIERLEKALPPPKSM